MSASYPDLDLTDFPQFIDTFKQWLDITATDGPLVKQYMSAIEEGNQVLANQILSKIPSGSQKIIKAIDLNKMSQAVLALERFYRSDIQNYIEEKQIEWDRVIDNFEYRGPWSSGSYYYKDNLVSYIIFGVEYIYIAIAKNVPVGLPPTDSRYWKKLTIQGMQGASGKGVSYREYWEVSDAYHTDDMVTYDGALWIALKPSQGVIPTQQSDSWKLIMTLASTAYPIQPIQPANQDAGDLWFDTSNNPTKFYYLEPLNNPATAEDIAVGKEVYNQVGERIVGTRQGVGGSVTWNSDTSPLSWNNGV